MGIPRAPIALLAALVVLILPACGDDGEPETTVETRTETATDAGADRDRATRARANAAQTPRALVRSYTAAAMRLRTRGGSGAVGRLHISPTSRIPR